MRGTNETFRRLINMFFLQHNLERRAAKAGVIRDPLTVAIDRHIVERDFQTVSSRGEAHEATERLAEEVAVA